MPKIICKHESKITHIILNNDDKRNAFDSDMSNQVILAIAKAEKLQQQVIVISANSGTGIFSAGHDLHELTNLNDLLSDPMFKMFDCITNSPLPIIAQVNGAVYAGALHLLMICDLVYATQASKVVITANKMGVPFSLHEYKQWLSVAGAHKVKELFYTASAIDAQDAYTAGIFNAVLSNNDELIQKVATVCQQIIQCCPAGVANTKLQLNALINNVSLDNAVAKTIEESRDKILNSDELKLRITALVEHLKHKS